jgi:biotin synthase
MPVVEIIARYRKHNMLTKEEITALLESENPQTTSLLRDEADRLRQEYVGNGIHLRALIEFSNYCIRNCAYCGIRRDNKKLPRYRMSPQEIIKTAAEAAEKGFLSVVLQSGDDLTYGPQVLAEVIREIKKTGIAVTLSVGERPERDYAIWREAGADRYLLKFETSDSELYRRLHPGSSLDKRLECIKQLKKLEYQTGSGNMVGLPGQTAAMLAEDIILMHRLKLDMAGIGPFLPHPATPLKDFPAGNLDLTLRVLALTRLLLPWSHLPATTALRNIDAVESHAGAGSAAAGNAAATKTTCGNTCKSTGTSAFLKGTATLKNAAPGNTFAPGSTAAPESTCRSNCVSTCTYTSSEGQRLALTGGANVLMVNLTPMKYRLLYEIYPKKTSPLEEYRQAQQLAAEIGRSVAADPGHGLSNERQGEERGDGSVQLISK